MHPDLYLMRIHDTCWVVGELRNGCSQVLGHYRSEKDAQEARDRFEMSPEALREARIRRGHGRIDYR